jgi:hypothetical protein
MARFTSKQTTVTIGDTNNTTYSMTVGPGPGDLTVEPFEEDNAEALPTWDRGVFDGFVEGKDNEQTFSITVELEAQTLTSAGSDRILDAVRKTGLWASATTTDPAGTMWAFKLVVTMSKGATTATITLPCCRGRASFSEDAAGQKLTISGTNYQAPTVT